MYYALQTCPVLKWNEQIRASACSSSPYVSEPNQLLSGFKLLSIYEHFQFDSCIQLYIYRDSISLASISRSVYVDYPAIIEFSTLTRPISSRIERNCFNANNRGLNSVKPGQGTVTFFPWKQSISWQRFEARAATFAGSCYGDVVVDTVDVEQRACVFPEVRSFQVDVSFMISQTDLSFWRSSFLWLRQWLTKVFEHLP